MWGKVLMIYKNAYSANDILLGADDLRINNARSCTSQMYVFDQNTAVVDFVTSCAGSKNSWPQRIQIMDYNYIVDREEDMVEEEVFEEPLEEVGDYESQQLDVSQQIITPTQPDTQRIIEDSKPKIVTFDDLKRLYPEIINSDLRVYCDCPDFIFRYNFITNQLDFHLEPQSVPPDITNTDQIGTVCKHIVAILSTYFV